MDARRHDSHSSSYFAVASPLSIRALSTSRLHAPAPNSLLPMRARPALPVEKVPRLIRRVQTTKTRWPQVSAIENSRLNETIEKEHADSPRRLGFNQLDGITAFYSWFAPQGRKAAYHSFKPDRFRPFSDAVVPLEYTGSDPADPTGESSVFKRFNAPLGMFLDYLADPPANTRLYLAQCRIPDLPEPLQQDLPVPTFIKRHSNKLPLRGNRGNREASSSSSSNINKKTKRVRHDIYDSSIWIGLPPTYTPLHRDPNPNCFVQLAGQKTIRLFPPEKGHEIFRAVKERIGEGGGDLSGRMRGEEMMMGREREELEKEVWGLWNPELEGVEARLDRGEGLFIPQGWWHSVRGQGQGINASVNWWFRWRE